MLSSPSFRRYEERKRLVSAELVGDGWPALEQLINECGTISDAELLAKQAGLRKVESFSSREEFSFETGEDFFTAPLIEDFFLEDWMSIVPESRRDDVREQVVSIIDRERHEGPFEISIKATVVTGKK